MNVMKEIDLLYERIEELCTKRFAALYAERYGEMCLWLTNEEPEDDEVDELVEMYLAGLLDIPNPVTHYAFHAELIRKRDRAKEAILSVPTRTQKQLELEKSVRHMMQQIGFYTDITEDEANLQALKDAGVKRVRWTAYGDEKVCDSCEDLNGTVFDIDKVPTKPHPRCRCYLVPVRTIN